MKAQIIQYKIVEQLSIKLKILIHKEIKNNRC